MNVWSRRGDNPRGGVEFPRNLFPVQILTAWYEPGTRVTQGGTAFAFAAGGSLGAIEVGMLRALTAAGVTADFVVGSSVGAINAVYYASDPTAHAEPPRDPLHSHAAFLS